MWIPLKYNVRSLAQRRVSTIVTSFGIAVSVAVFVAVTALTNGIRLTFVSTGDPLNIIVLRPGTQSETGSIIAPDAANAIATLDGIDRDASGRPMVSLERIVYVNHERKSDGSSNVVIRGVGDRGRELRPEVKLANGRWFEPGQRELVVSRSIADRFRNCALGDELGTGRVHWRVVGIFDAGSTAYASEMWTSAGDVGDAFQRPNFSSVLLRARDAAGARELRDHIENDSLIRLGPKSEREYFEEQTKSAAPIRVLGNLVSIIMAVGSAFAGMNTMYASVASRVREIAVLRALGFSRRAVVASFLFEAVMLALIGGVVGAAMSLPLNGVATGTTNWFSFSEMTFQFRVTPPVLARGLVFATLLGIAGGLLPALRASRHSAASTLRAI